MMKAIFLMATAIAITGTVAAQSNGTVKTTQSVDVNTRTAVKKTGQTAESNVNVSADASTAAQVKAGHAQQAIARAKKEEKAGLTIVDKKMDALQAATGESAAALKQEAAISGGSGLSLNEQEIATDITSASQLETKALHASAADISNVGKGVVNSVSETKKHVRSEAKAVTMEVKRGISAGGNNSASIKAAQKVKVDASFNQGAKIKPAAIGVKTRISGSSGLHLR